jgi:UDP-N-acetylmuramoylalanine--D-glutamate ligase
VTVTDQAEPATLKPSLEAIGDLGVALRLGGHDPRDLDETDVVVLNPAVHKARSELFREVIRRRIPWTTEMNLFCERCRGHVIAVTGTYGKSTTCEMLTTALENCRRRTTVDYTGVRLGGNIGRSLLSELDDIGPNELVVLEVSNAQLEDLPQVGWRPRLAVITNLSPHHLDRYSSYVEYVAVKLNILGRPIPTDHVVVGEIDTEAMALLESSIPDAVHVRSVAPVEPPVVLQVPGDHNQANAACVIEVCGCLRLDQAAVREALGSFRGLPHRLQHVRMLDGVDYCNDSKSTSPAATITATQSLRRPIVAIIGGQSKDVPLRACAAALVQACRAVICTGESGSAFANAVESASGDGAGPEVRRVDGLEAAINAARSAARSGDVVLFSPGAPSFDDYENFADRGQQFIDAVSALE